MTEYVFANPALNHAEDGALRVSENVYIGQYSGRSLEQMQGIDPNIQLIESEKFLDMVEARMTTDPVEIDKERFDYLLNCLPPSGWEFSDGAESFFMSEFTSGRVTMHLVRIGERYFSFEAPVMRSPRARVTKVLNFLNQPVNTGM